MKAACAVLPLCAPGPALAAPVWSDTAYGYVVLDQDIRATFTDFGRNLGIAVSLSDAVKGRVRGRVDAETAGAFLDRLTESNGLNWYFDGAVLHVSAASEYATRTVPAGGMRSEDVLAEMQRLDSADDRFAIRGGGDVISVSGPPAYVAAVRDVVQNMQPAVAAPDQDHPHVRVFRGRIGGESIATATPQP
ncbi:hypothetical protein QCN27_06880 [Cereibacter sp. SYSU M97828]|nr:hypothetical protein [Cereibacter flavus]